MNNENANNSLVTWAIDGLTEIVSKKLSELISLQSYEPSMVEQLKLIMMFIIHIKHDVRLYMFSHLSFLQELWERIRSEEVFTDFLLSTTVELNAALSHQKFDMVVQELSHSFGCFSADNRTTRLQEEFLAMDKDTYERLPSQGEFNNFLKNNPWLVTVILLSYVDLSEIPQELHKTLLKPK